VGESEVPVEIWYCFYMTSLNKSLLQVQCTQGFDFQHFPLFPLTSSSVSFYQNSHFSSAKAFVWSKHAHHAVFLCCSLPTVR
jgi:hypothetical protein